MSQDTLGWSLSGRLNFRTILALAGIFGPVILIAADLSVALNTPGYNFVRDSISSLAWAPRGWVQTIGFLAIGLLVELFAAGLFFSIRGKRGFGFGIGLLAIFGFGLLLIGAFHTDPTVGSHAVEGSIHGMAAKTIFWLFPFAALFIAPSLKKDSYKNPLFIYSIAAAVLSLVMIANSLWLPTDMRWFGLFERILVTDEILWIEIVAIRLLRYSLSKRKGMIQPVYRPQLSAK